MNVNMNNNGYIDIHTHILPGLDDGAYDLAETERMLQMAAGDCIGTMIATPHFIPGIQETDPGEVHKAVTAVNELSGKLGARIGIHSGNELYLLRGAFESVRKGNCLTLAGSRQVLCELPLYEPPGRENLKELEEMLAGGYLPVLAHPERYAWLDSRWSLLQELTDKGCLLQVNSGSLTGHGGKYPARLAEKLLKEDRVYYVASDCHDSRERRPELKDAGAFMEKKYGREKAEQMLKINGSQLFQNISQSQSKETTNAAK